MKLLMSSWESLLFLRFIVMLAMLFLLGLMARLNDLPTSLRRVVSKKAILMVVSNGYSCCSFSLIMCLNLSVMDVMLPLSSSFTV